MARNEYIKYFIDKWPMLELYGCNSGKCTCGQNCKSAGKHPKNTKGVHEAKIIKSDIFGENSNYGVACGQKGINNNYLIVIDVDIRNKGDQTLNDLQIAYGKLPLTWTVKTGSNDGSKHYYYQSKIPYASVKLTGIDIQCYGKYVVGPGCNHISGNIYDWDDYSTHEDEEISFLPLWIEDFLRESKEKNIITANISPISKIEFKEKVALLKEIPADEYSKLIEIGMALKETGHEELAYKAWINWAKKSNKFMPDNPGFYIMKWNSFKHCLKNRDGTGAISPKAIERIASETIVFEEINGSPVLESHEGKEISKEPVLSSHDQINNNLLINQCPDGLIKEIYSYILRNTNFDYHNIALAIALQCVSVVAQNSFNTYTNENLCLYQMILLDSGGGKNRYLNLAKKIVETVDLRLLLDDIGSAYGLKNELYLWNSKVLIQDEIQDLFSKLSDSNNVFLNEVLKLFKEIFNANERILGSVTKNEYSPDILNATMGMIGFGVAKEFYKTFTSKNVDGGLINRLIIWEIEKEKFNNNINKIIEDSEGFIHKQAIESVPQNITAMLKNIQKKGMTNGYENQTYQEWQEQKRAYYARNNDKNKKKDSKNTTTNKSANGFNVDDAKDIYDFTKHEPQNKAKHIVKIGKEAYALLNSYQISSRDKYLDAYDVAAGIIARQSTIAEKIATLSAIARNAPSVEPVDVKFGIVIADSISETMVNRLREYATDTQEAKDWIRVRKILQKSPQNQASRTEIQKATRYTGKRIDSVIQYAQDIEAIHLQKIPTSTNHKYMVILKK